MLIDRPMLPLALPPGFSTLLRAPRELMADCLPPSVAWLPTMGLTQTP